MANINIVTVNASVLQAPRPNNLQQVGGFVSQGGSIVTPGTATLVSTLSELQAVIAPAKTNATITWSGGVVTVTTVAPHGWTIGDSIGIAVSGALPSAYNGNYTGTVTTTTRITYPLVANPGASTAPGKVNLFSATELLQMGTTYFANNAAPSVYVVELGESTPTAGVPLLSSFIDRVKGSNSQIYSYLIPSSWDNNVDFLAFLGAHNAVNSLVYFWVTTTVANQTVYSTPAYKCVYAEVQAPGTPATEFSLASAFSNSLSQVPTSSTKLVPMSYSPSYGTTAYPVVGNQTTLTGLANNSVGWVGTGQQGGISSNIIYQGKMSDGNAWNFWFSVDWAQIQMQLALANEVINGSASAVNPLYYNQTGINRLQNRVVSVANQGVSSGVGNGTVTSTKLPNAQFFANLNAGLYAGQIVINAEPFSIYTAENPNDYALGKYAGLTCVWIPQLPFLNIVFNLLATDFLQY
jgi:hypothetical protein